jgi:hypothetical protein
MSSLFCRTSCGKIDGRFEKVEEYHRIVRKEGILGAGPIEKVDIHFVVDCKKKKMCWRESILGTCPHAFWYLTLSMERGDIVLNLIGGCSNRRDNLLDSSETVILFGFGGMHGKTLSSFLRLLHGEGKLLKCRLVSFLEGHANRLAYL